MIESTYKINDINVGMPTFNRIQLQTVLLDFINKKFIVTCILYNNESIDYHMNLSIELTEEEYNNWSNDDTYIIKKCLEKYNFDFAKENLLQLDAKEQLLIDSNQIIKK